MALLSLHNIRIAYGGPPLLENVSLNIEQGQRICILGRNGIGKSTFMKIIAGLERPDAGEIVSQPGLACAYMAQDVPLGEDGSVFELVAHGLGETGKKYVEWQRRSRINSHTAETHALHDYLDHHNGWQAEEKINRVLDRVGVKGDLDFASLSGGMRRRVFLARALVKEPELLLLDEPTNHLDIDSIAWLEKFLISSRLTVLFVTHDRRLLRRIVTRIIELDRGKLFDWACNYETFLSRKQALLDAEEKEWERFDQKLAQEEAWIRKGIRARRTRNEGRVRALNRMRAERRGRREQSGNVSMQISEAGRSGLRVLEAQGVTFGYNAAPIVNEFSITIGRGDRIGIVGPNGCGKTTLLHLLLGKIAPQSGTVRNGANLEISYFDQLRGVLDPEKSAWENVATTGGDTVIVNGAPRHVISYLQDFLFASSQIRLPVKSLSGGERNRLMLAKMFTQPANVLVFDEPTNDLDAETLELLEELLGSFNGTILVVSHDREFLNNVVTSMLVYEGNGLFKEYIGGYDDWQRQLALKEAAKLPKAVQPQKAQRQDAPAGSKKRTFKENKELIELPGQIEALEMECATLQGRMSDINYFAKPGFITNAKDRLMAIELELAAKYERWQELDSRPQ